MVSISYKTISPLIEASPKVYVLDDNYNNIIVNFIDSNNQLLKSQHIQNGGVAFGPHQWYTEWLIDVRALDGTLLHRSMFNPIGKTIFIKMDAFALGDNLAWIPYVEEFRKKHNCIVICSTFWNSLFEQSYKDILFVQPNTQISNVYAQYYIGTFDILPPCYAPTNHSEKPLQKVATDILGLDYIEKKPLVKLPTPNKQKTVCISEKASSPLKEWNGDWQKVVDYLNSEGYKVLVISKEPTTLQNVIDKTGNILLEDRIQDLVDCEFFIGVSSGLSWLAWAAGAHTFLISDFTPPNHEFKYNCTRIYSENCVKKIQSDMIPDSKITSDMVIKEIKKYNYK